MLVLAGWAVLLVAVRQWGLHIVATRDEDLKLEAIPLYGQWAWDITWWLLAPITVGVVAVIALPWLAHRWSWPKVLAAAATGGVLLSLALALAQTHPEVWSDIHLTYGRHIGLVDQYGVGRFIGDYAEIQRIPDLPVHLQSHPPGLTVFLWSAAKTGLAGAGFENTVAMLGVAAAIVAALVIMRDVAGEPTARAAAPFVVIAPAAVWHTNADIVFAGVVLAGVAGLIHAIICARTGMVRRAVVFAVTGGLLFGAALMMSFGAALLVVPVLAVALWRWDRARTWLALAAGGAAAAAVVLLPLLWGFWWLDGVAATRERYDTGVASVRGYWYFLVANLAVFALAVGPAIAVALSRLRDRRAWLVVASGLAVVVAADLSGLSSGETERIWQPFMPLVLLAGCVLGTAPEVARRWLALQLTVAVVLVAALQVSW